MIRISLCFEPARGGDGPVRPIAPLSVTAVRELTQLLNHELNLTPRYRSFALREDPRVRLLLEPIGPSAAADAPVVSHPPEYVDELVETLLTELLPVLSAQDPGLPLLAPDLWMRRFVPVDSTPDLEPDTLRSAPRPRRSPPV